MQTTILTKVTPKNKNELLAIAILEKAHADYEAGMRGYTFYKVQNIATTEDLIQDTFAKTWNYLLKEGRINLMKPFLYHILNCLIIDEYRRHKNLSLDYIMDKGFEPPGDNSSDSPYFDYDARLATNLIGQLPINYRQIIYLRYIKNLSLLEISNITGATKNTVAVQSHRGLEKLRFLYHDHKGVSR